MKKLTRLEVEDVNIKELELHPDNVRHGDIGAIMQSLEAHGQFRAIVVQKSRMRVCAGNHTTQAARLLGWDAIAAHVLDVDDDQALRILLADNQTSDLATNDEQGLIDTLKALVESEMGLDGTGFDEDDLDALNFDFMPEEPKPTPSEPMAELMCPECGFVWDV